MKRLVIVLAVVLWASVAARSAAQNSETRDEIRGVEFVQPVSCVDMRFRSIHRPLRRAVVRTKWPRVR